MERKVGIMWGLGALTVIHGAGTIDQKNSNFQHSCMFQFPVQ